MHALKPWLATILAAILLAIILPYATPLGSIFGGPFVIWCVFGAAIIALVVIGVARWKV